MYHMVCKGISNSIHQENMSVKCIPPHTTVCIGKLGFVGVYLIFLICNKTHICNRPRPSLLALGSVGSRSGFWDGHKVNPRFIHSTVALLNRFTAR